MSQPDNTPVWLAWIVPAGTVVAALWAFLRRFFNMATREEVQQAIRAFEAAHKDHELNDNQRHIENKEELARLRVILARIEERIEGRYPNLQGKRGP